MKRVLILGAGTFAIEVLEAIELGGIYEPLGFLVSAAEWLVSPVHAGLPVASIDEMPWTPRDALAIGGMVTTGRQAFLEAAAGRGFEFVTVIHPAATVSRRASFGPGCFVGAQTIVASNTRCAAHVLLNRGANIGHDVTIESAATIGPGVTIAGHVTVGAGAYLGVGAVVRDHVAIGAGAIVAAGAVVVKPVAPRTLVAGCPARTVRDNVAPL